MAGIYFFSDPHMGHKNLVRGCSSWEDKTACRDFDTIEEHNEVLIQNINKTVSQDSILYCAGDWVMGGFDNVWKFRKRLNVRTIHLVLGNHDNAIRNNKIVLTDTGYVNLQNLFASVQELLSAKIGGQLMTICHYPLRSWEKSSKGSWCLSGHEHFRLPDYEINGLKVKALDIGIDGNPEFRPYHFDEIESIMSKRFVVKIGHHE